jgi:preprotein translocase subunit SecE
VARDRKRAKQRRARQGRDGVPSTPGGRSSVGNTVRADVPGSLDHASGDVDEFDAALVRGAGGVPAEADDISDSPERLSEGEIEAEAENEGDLSEDEIQELAGPSGSGGGRSGGRALVASGGGGSNGGGVSPEQASGAPVRGNRAIGFLRASWAELQRVQWPDRRQVFQATAVVLGFVAIAGAYLGLADYVAKEIVEFIL